jgi:hypothetical protein
MFLRVTLFFLVGLGYDLKAACLQIRHSTTPPFHFTLVVLELGSQLAIVNSFEMCFKALSLQDSLIL